MISLEDSNFELRSTYAVACCPPSIPRPFVVFSYFRHLFQNTKYIVGLSWNLVGDIGATWRFRIAKIVPFWYPWQYILEDSNFELRSAYAVACCPLSIPCPFHIFDISFRIQMVVILKFLKWHLLPNHKLDWAKTWWEASEWHRDSGLLK